jgi:23S rRNA (cytosine1962-C5)-methyltransferase
VYSNEVAMDAAAKALTPGEVVGLEAADGRAVGAAFFNPHSLIAARLLSGRPDLSIDRAFLASRLARALSLREILFDRPFYRLVHAESDSLPGLIVDRLGDVLVCQMNSAGMDRLTEEIVAALQDAVAPRAIVLRNDSPVRALEGLDQHQRVASGAIEGPVEIEENGIRFLVDPLAGQKTGWFFDQRDNRAFVARLARARTVLDVYTYLGGFAIQAAVAGAARVVAVDRSEPALALAGRSAELNGVAGVCEFRRAEAFAELARLAEAKERFGIVICDPPAFVKSKKDLATGAKGYRKLARLAAGLVEPGGFLFLASCSHHMEQARFAEEVHRGLGQAGRAGRVLRQAGAAPDHPVHPWLPESAYLKAEVIALD